MRRAAAIGAGGALRLACLAGLALSGCGGTSPLLHPAAPLAPGHVTVGVGSTGRVALKEPAGGAGSAAEDLEHAAVAPGVAPWVGARVGLAGSNEAGLAWAGRSLRLDARHVFERGALALSFGAGASLVLPERRYGDARLRDVRGGGLDVPVLFGWASQAGLYAVWLGPRVGYERLEGLVGDAEVDAPDLDLSAAHWSVGGVLGARAGFRHVFVALELNGAYHAVDGSLGGTDVSFTQASLSPGGALVLAF